MTMGSGIKAMNFGDWLGGSDLTRDDLKVIERAVTITSQRSGVVGQEVLR